MKGIFARNFARRANAWIPRQSKQVVAGKRKGPNATEARYLRDVLMPAYGDGRHLVAYEPAPLAITRTTARQYTADFLVTDSGGANVSMRPAYHEVKGGYRLPTHDRARLAWEIAAERNPGFDFVWAELTRSGWEIERWEDGGARILVHHTYDAPMAFHVEQPDWRRHRKRKTR